MLTRNSWVSHGMNYATSSFDMNNPNPPGTFLGRCKRCKTARRIVAPVSRKYETKSYGRTEHKVFRRLPNGREIEAGSRFWIECERCAATSIRRLVEMNRIEGRKSEHKCGARCLNSTGFVCECSCAGANHGCGISLEQA
jgi:hypothetical protein